MVKQPIEVILDGVTWHAEPEQKPDESGLPHVTHSGTLKLGDVTLRVYQLSDGRRVIDGDDLQALFGCEP